jgi:flagellar hook-associated protein 2
MGGITSGTGLISGINTTALIQQLIGVESKPKVLAQKRLLELQTQQASYFDIQAKLGALKTAAIKLRTSSLFTASAATSSNADVLSATAANGALTGQYSFLVDRVVSTQQVLSRGFVDRSTSSTGATSITVEPAAARLDSETNLSILNGGQGVQRGKIVITNSLGAATTIDLSKAVTVTDVLDAFNNNTDLKVKARVTGGKLVLTDTAGGGGNLIVASSAGYSTAESLGIAKSVAPGSSLEGNELFTIGDATPLAALNDGNGIRFNPNGGTFNPDFKITARDGSVFQVDVGDIYSPTGKTSSQVATVGQLRARIESQTSGKITLQTSDNGRGFKLVDSTTGATQFTVEDSSGAAADLGIAGTSGTDTIAGQNVLAGLNTTLLRSVQGGRGVGDGKVGFTLRDSTHIDVDIRDLASLSDAVEAINTAGAGKVKAELNRDGNAVIITDSSGGNGPLAIVGEGADALGIATTGTNAATLTGTRIARQYITLATSVASLNSGNGIGIGEFRIEGPKASQNATIRIDAGVKTVGDVIKKINNAGAGVIARINDAGNGIVVEKDPAATPEAQKINITDVSGTTARALNLAGTAPATGATNKIDGAFRRTIDLTGSDTLDGIVTKLNAARAGVTATIVSDGSGATGYRLRISSTQAGKAGRLQFETAGADLGLSTIAKGDDSRVFFGSDDPAKAILVTRPSNTIDGVVEGVTITAKTASTTPVTVGVSRDNAKIVEAVTDFVSAFNTLSSRVGDLTKYDAETEKKGALLGDSVATSLRQELFSVINGRPTGVTGQYQNLTQVGITIGKDGTLQFNADKLQSALANDPQATADVLSGFLQAEQPSTVTISPGITTRNTAAAKFTKLGVLERIGQLADRYLDSVGGLLTNRNKNIGESITFQNQRIADFDARLASKQAFYERQFANLETSLAQLQKQQSSVASIASITKTS